MRVSASFAGMLFCPRQAEVVQTGDLPIALAISCQLRLAAAFAVRIALVTSSRVMAVIIREVVIREVFSVGCQWGWEKGWYQLLFDLCSTRRAHRGTLPGFLPLLCAICSGMVHHPPLPHLSRQNGRLIVFGAEPVC